MASGSRRYCFRPRRSAVDTFTVLCPFCGEEVEIFVEEDVRGSFVQDCEVCCNPWLVRVQRFADGADVTVERGDQ